MYAFIYNDMYSLFEDRRDAGRNLALALRDYTRRPNTIIMALPRGGVPVADEIASLLHLPLDIWLVRKLGMPGHEELALGAISWGEKIYLNDSIISDLGIPESRIAEIIQREREELKSRNQLYRGGKDMPDIKNHTVVIVDDGLATGASMRIAVESIRQAGAEHIIVAVPVGPEDVCRSLNNIADEVICIKKPYPFESVGQWYRDFSQTTDQEVISILQEDEK